MGDPLSLRVTSVQRHSKSSTGWKDGIHELKVYLQETMLPPLLHLLRSRFMTSPALKGFVFRVTKRLSDDRGFDHRLEFRKNRLSSLLEEKLAWTLFQLVTSDCGLKGLDSVTLIIELRRLVEKGSAPIVCISSSVYKVIADLCLYAELWVQCRAFEPVVFYHMSNVDHGLEQMETSRALVLEAHVVRELEQLAKPGDDKFLCLGHTVHHSEEKMPYPIEKPRNKLRNIIMQDSESVLDTFWDDFDKHVKGHCSKHIVDAWESLWPRQEDLRRTQDWTNSEAASLCSGFEAVNLNFGHTETKSGGQPLEKKSKKKKRKAQAPSSEDTENPRPDEADDGPAQPEKIKIAVSKRAWEVFNSGLLSVPENKGKAAQLRWQDFLLAMTSLGFSATQVFGSVWSFSPGEKAQSARLRGASAS